MQPLTKIENALYANKCNTCQRRFTPLITKYNN